LANLEVRKRGSCSSGRLPSYFAGYKSEIRRTHLGQQKSSYRVSTSQTPTAAWAPSKSSFIVLLRIGTGTLAGAVTVIVKLPVIPRAGSVTVIVWLPAVARTVVNSPTPWEKVRLAGKTAPASLLVTSAGPA